jgi:hypothetical protein
MAVSIPYAGQVVADLLGATQVKRSFTDLSSFSRPLSMVFSLANEMSAVAKTGDITGFGVNVARTLLPHTTPIINRLPGVSGRIALADAARVARVAAGPLEVKAIGGTGGEPSRFASLTRRAIAAEAAGDSKGAEELLKQAEAVKEKEQPGSNTRAAVRASIAGRLPSRAAFGRKLSPDEERGLLSRMGPSQRAAYERGTSAVTRLLGRTKAVRKGGPKKAKTAYEQARAAIRKRMKGFGGAGTRTTARSQLLGGGRRTTRRQAFLPQPRTATGMVGPRVATGFRVPFEEGY